MAYRVPTRPAMAPESETVLTAAACDRALADGSLTSAHLVEGALERIAAQDGRLNSFVRLCADDAMAAARAADAAIRRGQRRGPLHGVPFALKDIYETKGIPTTAQSRLLLDHVPAADCAVAARLAASGAILIGKLATHEFATGGPAYDLPFPPARNPWNTAHFTGGSSSGSAAAVAAGLVPLAMGSDTSGSIRGPAGYCGIAGFKPTYGVVSRKGVIPLSYSLDHCGPMAWTVEDCALMLDAIAGHDPGDPSSADRPYPSSRAALAGGIAGMRIGVVRHFHERDIDADPEAVAALEAALGVLQRLGATLVPVTLPPHQDWDACCRIILYGEAYAIHQRDLAERPEQYAAITRARLMSGAVVSAADYVQATRWRRQLCRQYAAAMDGLDALVTGGTLAPAPRLDDLVKPPFFTWHYRMVMAPFSVTGAPALSLCCGFSSAGLPLSLQIAGRPFADATVLRIGHAFERATPWRDTRPNLDAAA
jgi:aspartyl-tRNA(Asn)/glutamyl-tRNA(Gln) amidotransferase subunit A